MSNPYARPANQPDDADLTIPLVPDAGYGQPSQPPFTEETLIDPLPQAPRTSWDSTPAQEFGYNPTPGYSSADPYSSFANDASSYAQPGPQRQPSGYPSSAPAPVAEPNYAQPQVGYSPGAYQPYPAAANRQPAPAPVAPWTASAPVPYTFSEASLPEHPNATSSLVLGILGIVGVWPLGPIAWFLSARAKQEMRQNPGRWRSSGSLTAGMVLGVITTVMLAFAVLAFLLFMFAIVVSR